MALDQNTEKVGVNRYLTDFDGRLIVVGPGGVPIAGGGGGGGGGTIAAPNYVRLSDLSVGYDIPARAQLPAALVGGRLSVDASGVAVPITDNAGSLTIDSPQLPAALVGARLDVNVGASVALSVTETSPKTTAAAPYSNRLSDGGAFYKAVTDAQLPAALVSSRLDVNIGAAPAVLTTQWNTATGEPNTHSGVSVTVADTAIIAANASRVGLQLVNDGAFPVYLRVGTTAATASTGIRLNANGGSWDGTISGIRWRGAVRGIAVGGTSVVTVEEI